jgi:peptidoglycan biosynthesis protein MviN/MurJ (putative lipid II flippase)
MMTTRGIISLVLGVIVGLLGLLPLCHQIKILSFDISSSIPAFILYILVVAGGIFLLIDSVHEITLRWISVVLGIIVVMLGMVGLLSYMGIIAFKLGFIPELLWNIIYIVTGVFLIFGSGD